MCKRNDIYIYIYTQYVVLYIYVLYIIYILGSRGVNDLINTGVSSGIHQKYGDSPETSSKFIEFAV